MDLDPHSIHEILQRIRQQMRCPQCGERMPIDVAMVRIAGDDSVVLQVKCGMCDAYIVLHASLRALPAVRERTSDVARVVNVSSTICDKDHEIEALTLHIAAAGGSFEAMFAKK